MIHKNRANRKWQDEQKAKRKQAICLNVYHKEWYETFGQYRKGKVHCSCAMCAAKTGGALNKSNGPVDQYPKRGSCRLAVTNGRCGRRNYRPVDRRKVDSMNSALKESLYA